MLKGILYECSKFDSSRKSVMFKNFQIYVIEKVHEYYFCI